MSNIPRTGKAFAKWYNRIKHRRYGEIVIWPQEEYEFYESTLRKAWEAGRKYQIMVDEESSYQAFLDVVKNHILNPYNVVSVDIEEL